MLIFAVAGIPLVVASVFSRALAGVVAGAMLLLIDFFLVPREKYESSWRAFGSASPGEKAGVIGSLIFLLVGPLFGWMLSLAKLLPGSGTYWLSLFLSFVLFLLWFVLRLAIRFQ